MRTTGAQNAWLAFLLDIFPGFTDPQPVFTLSVPHLFLLQRQKKETNHSTSVAPVWGKGPNSVPPQFCLRLRGLPWIL